jgi:hypothetical protein
MLQITKYLQREQGKKAPFLSAEGIFEPKNMKLNPVIYNVLCPVGKSNASKPRRGD